MTNMIIPNHNPNLYAVLPVTGESGVVDDIILEPIVAWIITKDGRDYETRPITPTGGYDESSVYIWNRESQDWSATDGAWGTGMDDLKKQIGIGEL